MIWLVHCVLECFFGMCKKYMFIVGGVVLFFVVFIGVAVAIVKCVC